MEIQLEAMKTEQVIEGHYQAKLHPTPSSQNTNRRDPEIIPVHPQGEMSQRQSHLRAFDLESPLSQGL